MTSKCLAYTASSMSVGESTLDKQGQRAPSAHLALLSREIICCQAQHKLVLQPPVLLHQYPGQEIWISGMHHQGSDRDWAPSSYCEQGRRFLFEEVLKVSHSNPEFFPKDK